MLLRMAMPIGDLRAPLVKAGRPNETSAAEDVAASRGLSLIACAFSILRPFEYDISASPHRPSRKALLPSSFKCKAWSSFVNELMMSYEPIDASLGMSTLGRHPRFLCVLYARDWTRDTLREPWISWISAPTAFAQLRPYVSPLHASFNTVAAGRCSVPPQPPVRSHSQLRQPPVGAGRRVATSGPGGRVGGRPT